MNRALRLALYVISPLVVLEVAASVFALVSGFLPNRIVPYVATVLVLGGFALITLVLFKARRR